MMRSDRARRVAMQALLWWITDYGSCPGQAVVYLRRPYVVKGVGTIPAFVVVPDKGRCGSS